MLVMKLDGGKATFAANGELGEIAAELLHGISTIYRRVGAALGDDTAETFREIVTCGVMAPESPVWEKDEDGTSVSFGVQPEEEG